jgi:hypothetical protein
MLNQASLDLGLTKHRKGENSVLTKRRIRRQDSSVPLNGKACTSNKADLLNRYFVARISLFQRDGSAGFL